MSVIEICDRCGKMIKDGEIRFKVLLTASADDGGMVEQEITDAELEDIISEIENENPVELNRQVYEERMFILCRECKQSFLKKPFGLNPGDTLDDDVRRVFH